MDITDLNSTQSLGLGLAIVQRLCRFLGYPMEVRSRPGNGTVFSIMLPKGDAHHGEHRAVAKPTQRWDLQDCTILIIDDEQNILDAMQALLEKWGCRVLAAESYADAVEQLKHKDVVPSMIISDLRLGHGEIGFKTIDALQNKFCGTILEYKVALIK